jgi:endonuclease III
LSRDEDQHEGSSGRPGVVAPGLARGSGELTPMAGEDARYELNWENRLQLLVATILPAQCTDERIDAVTPALFARYRDAEAFARADLGELEEAVRSTGYCRNKARAIRDACAALFERFCGEVNLVSAEAGFENRPITP